MLAVIGVGAALLGAGAIAGGSSLAGGIFANRANRKLVRQQMAFQERMSNTAYQRAVADMRSAGLNPILAAKTAGASTPTGSIAQMQNVGAGVSDAISTGAKSALVKSQADLMHSQTGQAHTQQAVNEDTALLLRSKRDGQDIDNIIKGSEIPGASAKEAFDRTAFGKYLRYLSRGLDPIKGLPAGRKSGMKRGPRAVSKTGGAKPPTRNVHPEDFIR